MVPSRHGQVFEGNIVPWFPSLFIPERVEEKEKDAELPGDNLQKI